MAIAKVFKFLSDEEYQALLQASERKAFKADDVLIKEGEEHTNLFIIVKGEVKVQRDHGEGFSIELSRSGPGEVFGDMSFLEDQPAGASVLAADDEVLAFVISHEHVRKMTQTDPAFAGHFYQSLAEILSRRLRDTTSMVGSTQDADGLWGNS